MIVTDVKSLTVECQDASIMEAPAIISKLEASLAASETPGIGLAANQIGINKKICIIRTREEAIDLVNPVIVEKEDLMLFRNEGCLSFPGQYIITKRYNEILVKDLLNPKGIVCTGLTAVVVQHEIGHLYGETMYDYKIDIPGPNEHCWCSSGKKFKKCHSNKEIKTL